MKKCNRCHKVKDRTEFSKCKINKDGLQYKCKSCDKETNLKFRSEINPQHHQKWQWDNVDKYNSYIRRYRKADKLPIIYSISAPDGNQYIGQTMMHLSVRLNEHRRHYRRALIGKRERLALLHDSFDKYGIDNHQFDIVKELPNFTRKQLKEVESAYITLNQFQNISLNTRK